MGGGIGVDWEKIAKFEVPCAQAAAETMKVDKPYTLKNKTNNMISRLMRVVAAAMAVAVCMLAQGCVKGDGDAAAEISDAELEVREGNYQKATEVCNELKQSADSASLTAKELCRMSLIYAAAADRDIDSETNMAQAVGCLERAYQVNRDSVEDFIENLPVDQMSTARIALMLLSTKGLDMSDYIDEDSVHIEEDEEHPSLSDHGHEFFE